MTDVPMRAVIGVVLIAFSLNALLRPKLPPMAKAGAMPDRNNPKILRIRFTCNGQTTPGQQSMENGVADLRCERNADLGY